MHRQSSAGLTSKWELVHYGSAARYFTTDFEIDDVTDTFDKISGEDKLISHLSEPLGLVSQ